MDKNVLAFLEKRGFIEWTSNADALGKLFEEETVTGYIGFDPTADSLHVGHLIPIMGLSWMQRMGHRPIFLAGGGTGLIGDPSGKSKERNLLSLEQMGKNLEAVKKQFARFVDFEDSRSGAALINNYEWLGEIDLLTFLREVGKYFSVNYMVNREYVRSRLEDPEKSISYTEFTYMLLQAYDFYHLMTHENCKLQMGGNDQQGNIIGGIDLIRKKSGKEVYGATYPLLLTSSGGKFGKTEDGAVWLDPERTSPYQFYQFWMNTEDQDLSKLLRLFTFLPLEEILEIEKEAQRQPEKRLGQKILAEEITRIVHGEQSMKRVQHASGILFGGAFSLEDLDMETLTLLEREVPGECVSALPDTVVEMLGSSGACKSNGEARRLIRGGGVSLNGEKVLEEARSLGEKDLLFGKYLFFRLGKKKFFMVSLSQ
jgi:tyrosyl-tRNA synthetase